MKIYVCTDHDSHYPVGVASVIVAWDRRQAKKLLDIELEAYGLLPFKQSAYELTEVSTTKAAAIILCDGDY